MIIFIVSIALLLILIWLVLPHLQEISWLDRSVVFFLLVCSDIILVLEIVGLIGLLKYPAAILGTQFLIVIAVFIFNWVKKIKMSLPVLDLRQRIKITRADIPIIIFASLMALAYGFLLFLQFRFPQNTSDSLYNHLSRIGFWLQQGSLNHYFSFSDVGTTFPYNNSLLMLWSVAFLKSDAFVGLVQFIALIFLVITICAISREFGYSKKGSLLTSLIFLTFPIIALESITAQNDILVSAFLIIAFYFLLKFSNTAKTQFLIFSLLAYALAIGTKQHALFALPGYAGFSLWVIVKHKYILKKILVTASVTTLICALFFGSYAYIQNWVVLGSPVGSKIFVGDDQIQNRGSVFQKAAINSSRLFTQFISCDGLPPTWESKCIQIKTSVVRPVFRNTESPIFLLEINEPFSLDRKYLLNEESAWFGLQSWILIIPALLFTIIASIKQKKTEVFFFILTAIIYWIWTSIIKPGWDPYVGRYLIFAIALVMPFTAGVFDTKKWFLKIAVFLLLALSFFSVSYAILNNDSRPLVSKAQLVDIQLWGKEHSLFVQKIAYKLTPLVRHEKDVWNTNEIILKTAAWGGLQPVFESVEKIIPQDANLVILTKLNFFPDYLLFGKSFTRHLVEITEVSQLESVGLNSFYLLSDPEFGSVEFKNLVLINKTSGWSIYQSR